MVQVKCSHGSRTVVWVTLAYFGVYYAILLYGLFTKRRVARQCEAAGEKFYRYSKQYPELLAADRMQLNMLEHMPPVLVLLWLRCCCVCALGNDTRGGLYARSCNLSAFSWSTYTSKIPTSGVAKYLHGLLDIGDDGGQASLPFVDKRLDNPRLILRAFTVV